MVLHDMRGKQIEGADGYLCIRGTDEIPEQTIIDTKDAEGSNMTDDELSGSGSEDYGSLDSEWDRISQEIATEDAQGGSETASAGYTTRTAEPEVEEAADASTDTSIDDAVDAPEIGQAGPISEDDLIARLTDLANNNDMTSLKRHLADYQDAKVERAKAIAGEDIGPSQKDFADYYTGTELKLLERVEMWGAAKKLEPGILNGNVVYRAAASLIMSYVGDAESKITERIMTDLEIIMENLKSDIASRETSIGSYRQENNSYRKQLADLRPKIDALDPELDSVDAQLQKLQADHAKAVDDGNTEKADALWEEVQFYDTTLQELDDDYAAKAANEDQIQDAIKHNNSLIKQYGQQKAEIQTDLNAAKLLYSGLQFQLKRANSYERNKPTNVRTENYIEAVKSTGKAAEDMRRRKQIQANNSSEVGSTSFGLRDIVRDNGSSADAIEQGRIFEYDDNRRSRRLQIRQGRQERRESATAGYQAAQ